MTRSPDSLIPFGAGQPASEKRDDKAFDCRQEGEANLRAATQVNVGSATATGHSIRWTGLSETNCSYGFGASIGAPGGLLRSDGISLSSWPMSALSNGRQGEPS